MHFRELGQRYCAGSSNDRFRVHSGKAVVGMLMRSPDPGDGRRVLITLTDEGERRLRCLSDIHAKDLGAIGETLGDVIKSLNDRASE
jgi:hypothetical protein